MNSNITLVCGCIHIPFHDQKALNVFLKLADQLNPAIQTISDLIGKTKISISLVICLGWIVFYTIFSVLKFEKEDL